MINKFVMNFSFKKLEILVFLKVKKVKVRFKVLEILKLF